MTRKLTYTIQAGYDTEEEEWSFKDWLWRILLITFVVGIITVGIAAMTLIIVNDKSLGIGVSYSLFNMRTDFPVEPLK